MSINLKFDLIFLGDGCQNIILRWLFSQCGISVTVIRLLFALFT